MIMARKPAAKVADHKLDEARGTTGELQMVALTTRSIYQAERAFLDVQHNRLIVKAIEKRGDAPSWGFFRLFDLAWEFSPSLDPVAFKAQKEIAIGRVWTLHDNRVNESC
jgi:hypothetical protein